MNRGLAVREGACFAQITKRQAGGPRWRVEGIYRDWQDVQHARLVNLDDPTITKTLAAGELVDERQFACLAQAGPR